MRVTRVQLARELSVNPRTVAKFLEEGMPIGRRGRGGRPSLYDVAECRAWLEARNHVAEQDGPIDLTKERARKERAQALLAEQLYAVRSKALLSAEEVLKTWAAEISAARALILQSYITAADRVFRAATTDGLPGVERELREIANAALRELSGAPTPKARKRKAPRKAAA